MLSVLQAFVKNDGDGWDWLLARLADNLLPGTDRKDEITPWLRRLGGRTADLHRAFGIETSDPAFCPEPVIIGDLRTWAADAHRLADRVLEGLEAAGDRLAADARTPANTLIACSVALHTRLDKLLLDKVPENGPLPTSMEFCKTRRHGDYHLGQVLVADGDAMIVDFEGEPMRSLTYRRRKHSVLRDVAGLLRSLDYAAATCGRKLPDTLAGRTRTAALAQLDAWKKDASDALLDAYLAAARGLPCCPSDGAVARRLVHFFMLEKALYEITYELANRPDQVAIPLQGVLALLDDPERMPVGPDDIGFTSSTSLDLLAERMGIETEFRDARGVLVRASDDTRRRLLAAMGVVAADDAKADAALEVSIRAEWKRPLPPAQVSLADTGPIVVDLVMPVSTGNVGWRLALEDGGTRSGQASFTSLELVADRSIDGQLLQRRRLMLPGDLPWGYHRLAVEPAGGGSTLIVTPGRCWLPPALAEGRHLWGIAAQLYLLRSDKDWGIGDFGDLLRLVTLGATHGADVIGLNPLHALFTDRPEHASPYSPASRLLLNVLYIDVPAVPALLDCPAARQVLASEEYSSVLRDVARCRSKPLVDYTGVAVNKLVALEAMFTAWRKSDSAGRRDDFAAFRRDGGEVLERNCRYLALREHFAGLDRDKADWQAWPDEYRHPDSPAVLRFAHEKSDRVEFQVWLQWLADDQLGAVAALASDRAMEVGLYRDLAVGADRGGAETWANPDEVVSDAQVGAPPDIHNPIGQDWGLPPFHPTALRDEAYRSFVELLRANMRHAGGLRIDHVMGLQQLYWIPRGQGPAEGAFVRYPMSDLLGILALESHRQRCLVVGEDLGTVPEGFRDRMARANVLSYRVLFFERDEGTDAFIAPAAYPALAMAVIGNHDLPTLRGWWGGRDIDLKERLGLFPGADGASISRRIREQDRLLLLQALRRERLLPDGNETPDVSTLVRAAHRYLANSASLLALVQVDDLTGETDPVNLPTTSDEHPNWRRRLALTLEEFSTSIEFAAMTEDLKTGRRQ